MTYAISNIDDLIRAATKKALSPVNWVLTPTRRAVMDLCATSDGPVSIKNGLIIVPVDIFWHSTFKSYKRRVVLRASDLSIKEIIK